MGCGFKRCCADVGKEMEMESKRWRRERMRGGSTFRALGEI